MDIFYPIIFAEDCNNTAKKGVDIDDVKRLVS